MSVRQIAEGSRSRRGRGYPREFLDQLRVLNEHSETVEGSEWAREALPDTVGDLDREIGAYLEFYAIAGRQVA